ncbi:MAG TPA: cbb3-type cytochrome c oxidase subunit 3 [Verrucomicrobiae bacterium]|nr:cbb3-type cytochrome c oxidase subunit 3 [Verrucomicrobiae bacterium]
MIEHVLHDIDGIELFGIVSVALFFIFFTGMLIWAIRLKKTYLKSMQDLPLDGGEKNSNHDPIHE